MKRVLLSGFVMAAVGSTPLALAQTIQANAPSPDKAGAKPVQVAQANTAPDAVNPAGTGGQTSTVFPPPSQDHGSLPQVAGAGDRDRLDHRQRRYLRSSNSTAPLSKARSRAF